MWYFDGPKRLVGVSPSRGIRYSLNAPIVHNRNRRLALDKRARDAHFLSGCSQVLTRFELGVPPRRSFLARVENNLILLTR